MTDYYNTDKEKGMELEASKQVAVGQEERIMLLLKTLRMSQSPSQLHACHVLKQYPITSIRRAMTNLTIKGKLVKTDKQVVGPYNKREHLWRLP